jgi:hypothetical protein
VIVAESLGPSFGHLSGIPILFDQSLIHGNLQQETTGHLTEIEEYYLSLNIFQEG